MSSIEQLFNGDTLQKAFMSNLVSNFFEKAQNGGNRGPPVNEHYEEPPMRRAQKRDFNGEPRRPIQCFGCGGPHFIRECPAKMGQNPAGMMGGMQPQQQFMPQQQLCLQQQMVPAAMNQIQMGGNLFPPQQPPVVQQAPVQPPPVVAPNSDTDARIASLTKEVEDLKASIGIMKSNHVDHRLECEENKDALDERTESLRQNIMGIETRLPQAEQAFMLASVCKKQLRKLEKDYLTSHQTQTTVLLKMEAALQRIQASQQQQPQQQPRANRVQPVRFNLVDDEDEPEDDAAATPTPATQEPQSARRARRTPEQARQARQLRALATQ